jgi:hypothetical protein
MGCSTCKEKFKIKNQLKKADKLSLLLLLLCLAMVGLSFFELFKLLF